MRDGDYGIIARIHPRSNPWTVIHHAKTSIRYRFREERIGCGASFGVVVFLVPMAFGSHFPLLT